MITFHIVLKVSRADGLFGRVKTDEEVWEINAHTEELAVKAAVDHASTGDRLRTVSVKSVDAVGVPAGMFG